MKTLLFVPAFLLFSCFTSAGPRIIGNGGDLTSSDLLTTEDLRSIIPETRLQILSWSQKTAMHDLFSPRNNRESRSSALEKWLQEERLLSTLNRLSVEISVGHPCPSSRGHTDASIVAENPPRICISAVNLRKKLTPENATTQIAALLVHEISHLLGADEEEAIALQKRYSREMMWVAPEYSRNAYAILIDRLAGFSLSLEILSRSAESPVAVQKSLGRLLTEFRLSDLISPHMPTSTLSTRNLMSLQSVFFSLNLAQRSLYPDPTPPPRSSPSVSIYDRSWEGFRDRSRLTIEDYFLNKNRQVPTDFDSSYVLRRVQDKNSFEEQIEIARAALSKILSDLKAGDEARFPVTLVP